MPIFAGGFHLRTGDTRASCVFRSKETSAASGIFCVLFLTECNKVKFKQTIRVFSSLPLRFPEVNLVLRTSDAEISTKMVIQYLIYLNITQCSIDI